MHYYKRNIGDYAKKTGRLSMLEHGAYTLLIDACYDRERFPTESEAIEWSWARSDQEISAVRFILDRFFNLEGDLYVQSRIRDELATYHETSATNKRIAFERERIRRERTRTVDESSPDVHEAPPNHEPLTINHKPIDKKVSPPEGVSIKVWADFIKHRNALKAPITDTAIAGIQREATKAGISLEQSLVTVIENNWRGFKAEWFKGKAPTANVMRGVI